MMTAPFPPTSISHNGVLKRPERADSVGLMEADMEMVGADSMCLIVMRAHMLYQ